MTRAWERPFNGVLWRLRRLYRDIDDAIRVHGATAVMVEAREIIGRTIDQVRKENRRP